MAFVFDGINREVTLTSATSSLVFTTNELYSRWVEWVQTAGSQFDEVFTTVGGESIGNGESAGLYLFINFGWSLVLDTGLTEVTIRGNFGRAESDLSGAPLFVNTQGALIVQERSVVAIGYSQSGSTSSDTKLDQIISLVNLVYARLTEVWNRLSLGALARLTKVSDTVYTEEFDGFTLTHTEDSNGNVETTRS